MKKSLSFSRLIWQVSFLAVLLFGLSACGGRARPFTLIQDGMALKTARLAVICGDTDDLGKNFTAAVTDEMRARTSFKVMSQEEIGKKIKRYPFNIKMVKKEGVNPQQPVWLDPSETKKLKALQAKLKVDYLFVVWGNGLGHYFARNGSSTTEYYYMSVYGNMFEYPKGSAVSFTDFSYKRHARFWEQLAFKKSNFYINSLIKNSAKYLVDNFIKVTNSGKTA